MIQISEASSSQTRTELTITAIGAIPKFAIQRWFSQFVGKPSWGTSLSIGLTIDVDLRGATCYHWFMHGSVVLGWYGLIISSEGGVETMGNHAVCPYAWYFLISIFCAWFTTRNKQRSWIMVGGTLGQANELLGSEGISLVTDGSPPSQLRSS